MKEAPDPPRPRPLLRGVSHEIAAGVALAGLVALVLLAPGPRARTAALVYGCSLVPLAPAMYGALGPGSMALLAAAGLHFAVAAGAVRALAG